MVAAHDDVVSGFFCVFFQSASPTTRTDCPPEDEAAPAAVKEAVCEVDTARWN